MIDSKDLRCGNLLHYYGLDVIVLAISKDSADLGYFTDSIGFTRHYDVDFPKPISLTEDWLERFGFEKKGGVGIYWELENVTIFVEDGKFTNIIEEEIESVHALQNYFHALKRKELELTK